MLCNFALFPLLIGKLCSRACVKALHVIVFDEFDAIGGKRSDANSAAGKAANSVVSQLLAKMDGLDTVDSGSFPFPGDNVRTITGNTAFDTLEEDAGPPVLFIALTNRKDLLDAALLRPGRLEVHIEMTAPDLKARRDILDMHCGRMRSTGRLCPGLDDAAYEAFLLELAKSTPRASGADIVGMVRCPPLAPPRFSYRCRIAVPFCFFLFLSVFPCPSARPPVHLSICLSAHKFPD